MAEGGAAALRQWEPDVWGDLALFEGDNDEEAAESEAEEAGRPSSQRQELVLESRPLGLELCPAAGDGRGAVLLRCGAAARAAGAEPGSRLVAINETPVEGLPTTEIRGRLDEEPLPVTLSLKPSLNLPAARRMKGRARDPVTLCSAHCRGSYRVVQAAIGQLRWKEYPAETRETSVVWLEHSDPTDGFAPVQTVTRLDAFIHMCRKAPLARCLNQWAQEFPEDFAFTPQTWILPYDAAELETAMSKTKAIYIAKPSMGTQGRGIVLARKWGDLADVVQKSKAMSDTIRPRTNLTEYVVQRYIMDPLLIDDLKFDLRIYVVVTSVVPLRAYLFREGLARFATVPYQPPKDNNLSESCMHLTNFAVNKMSKDFQSTEGLANHDEGSKRSISSVFWQIEQNHGVSADSMWDKVGDLVSSTLMALRPRLLEYYAQKKTRPLHPLAPKGFQIIGLDVLLDSSLEPHLLELNANPSLSITQPGAAAPADESPEPAAEEAPEAGGAARRPAGSGAQAARAARAEDSPKSPGRRGEEGAAQPAAGGQGGAALERLCEKLRLLSDKDLATVERGVDALLSDGAGREALPAKAPAPQAAESSRGRRPPAASAAFDRERAGSLSTKSRKRLGLGRSPSVSKGSKKSVVSHLDLEIKRELIVQALLLTRPAPICKVERLRKQWLKQPLQLDEQIPLDDDGAWMRSDVPQEQRPEVREDAPERCPALEPLNLQERSQPEELAEYVQAHFGLYRCWQRACGPSQDTLGQAQMQKILERRGFVGPGALFPDKVSSQLWLARTWRTHAEGAFGLDLPQFVRVAGILGDILLAGGAGPAEAPAGGDDPEPSIRGVLEFVRRSNAGQE